jgi:hypothetical protein
VELRPLDVREEIVAEPRPTACAFDQSGNVGDDQLSIGSFERAEDRFERREGIARDLWCGTRQSGHERGFAGVGKPDQADVGEQLQPQAKACLLPDEAALTELRRLPSRRGEMLVAAPTGAAARDDHSLAGTDQIVEVPVVGADLRPRRHSDHQLGAVSPVAQTTRPMTAAARSVVLASTKRLQITQRRVALDDHAAAVSAVAAVRSPMRHVRLAPEALGAVTAGAGRDRYAGFVVEHSAIVDESGPHER